MCKSSTEQPKVFCFDYLNNFDGKSRYSDPGNHESERYKQHMSKTRFWCREKLLRLLSWSKSENAIAYIQSHYRTHYLDLFFAFTAIMGSHTFYMVMIPIPYMTGQNYLSRDLVYILGYSIYLSGHFKDYWCLPRPRSPPCHRITLSEYTTKEYGAPSSHTANATGVTLLLISYIVQTSMSMKKKSITLITVAIYFFVLVFGRIYCGMHGAFDIVSGILVGITCFLLRFLSNNMLGFDNWSTHAGWWFPFFSISLASTLIKLHARPVDECPCIEDSVAFIGVIAGVECSDWLSISVIFRNKHHVSFDYVRIGAVGTFLRIVIGVTLVVAWKHFGKKFVYYVLSKILGDDRPVKISQAKHHHVFSGEVQLFTPLFRIDVVGRFIIYFCIAFTVIVTCPFVYALLGL